jgi:SAM-dependent methyltransferase
MNQEYFDRVLPIYRTPSQSLWRAYELAKVIELRDRLGFERPILEVGCGDGGFTALVLDHVDDGVDINPRSLERCRAEQGDRYERLHRMDARKMDFPEGTYGTVFSNCVLEHIPGLPEVLASSYRALKKGGKMVATVPLREMNDHLAVRSERYAEMRRRQLVHVNLLTSEEWDAAFRTAGFSRVEQYPYFHARQCRIWDRLDVPLALGVGRYRLGTAMFYAGRALLPDAAGRALRGATSRLMSGAFDNRDPGAPCAAAIVAYKE